MSNDEKGFSHWLAQAVLESAAALESPDEVAAQPALNIQQKFNWLRAWRYDAAQAEIDKEGMDGRHNHLLRYAPPALRSTSDARAYCGVASGKAPSTRHGLCWAGRGVL